MGNIFNTKVKSTLSDEAKASLIGQIQDLLTEYDHENTERGVRTIVDEWWRNNQWIDAMLRKHPNYVEGKFYVAFSKDYTRATDPEVVSEFFSILRSNFKARYFRNTEEATFGNTNLTYSKCDRVRNACYNMCRKPFLSEEAKQKWSKWFAKYSDYCRTLSAYNYVCQTVDENGEDCFKAYSETAESNKAFSDFVAITQKIETDSLLSNMLSDEAEKLINEAFPDAHAHRGAKISKTINKLCKLFGYQELKWWNREFADFADAINPLHFKRHTIISINPIDYLTMSFGHNWASCQTIDRENNRCSSDNHHGMYCSGTLSYMLDGTTLVMYIVDKNYDGTDFELQDKEKRCLFGLGENKILQYRVYPDDRDGSDEPQIGEQMRQIMQQLVADCLDVPNLWKNKKGSSACAEITKSYGTHYRDYLNYNNGVISFYNDGEGKNMNVLHIGHDPICPCCGETHNEDGSLCCSDCERGTEVCEHCGDHFDPESYDAICAEDGTQFCCSDCAHDHGYEYVRDAGWYYVRDNVEIQYDNWSEEYFFVDSDSIHTEDDNWYIDEYNARRDGYVYCENVDEWYKADDDDVYISSYTDEYFYDDGDAVFTYDGQIYVDEDEAHDAGYYRCDDLGDWFDMDTLRNRYPDTVYELVEDEWVEKEEELAAV